MAQISGCSKTVTQLNQITGCTEFDSSFLLLIVDTINGETMNIPVQTMFNCMGNDNFYLTAGTYSGGYIYFSGTGTNFAVDVNALLDDTNTYVTGATLSGDTFILYRNDGVNIYTDFSQYNYDDEILYLDNKIDAHTGDTNNPHQTSFYNLTQTAHTHTISEITDYFDIYLSAGTYSDGFIYFSGHGMDFSVDVSGLLDNTDFYLTAGTYSGGYIYFSGVGTNFVVDVSALIDDTNTYLTGSTLSGNTLILEQNNGTNIYTDLSALLFTGDCINDFYVNNIHGCLSAVTLYNSFKSPTAIIDGPDNSFAFGDSTIASGDTAFAFGYQNMALNDYTFVIGYGNTGDTQGSFASGYLTRSSGLFAATFGYQTVASGNGSLACGILNTASGRQSFAAGRSNLASGEHSFVVGKSNLASGAQTFAAGQSNLVIGNQSFAAGQFNIASGSTSFAAGSGTTALEECSTSFGLLTTASGPVSFATGWGNIASGVGSFVEGGAVEGKLFGFDSLPNYSMWYSTHAEGAGTIASGACAHSEGFITAASGDYAHSQGCRTLAMGLGSHAGGSGDGVNLIIANGIVAFNHSYCDSSVSGVTGDYSFILGGLNHSVNSLYAGILGGQNNTINYGSNYSVIIGGKDNNINNLGNTILLGTSGLTNVQSATTYVNQLVIVQPYTPTTSGDTYGVEGQITWDNNYEYIKTEFGWGRILFDYGF